MYTYTRMHEYMCARVYMCSIYYIGESCQMQHLAVNISNIKNHFCY